MGTNATIEDGIWDWANAVLNPLVEGTGEEEGDMVPPENPIPIIWAHQGGPKPKYSYVLLRVLSNIPRGMSAKGPVVLADPEDPEDMGTQAIRWDEDILINIQGIGPGADEYIHALRESFEYQWTDEFLDSKKLALRDSGDITNVSEILDEKTEPRWSMDVTFGVGKALSDIPGWIEQVSYSGEYNPQP